MAYGLSFQPSEDNKRGASGTPKVGTQNAVQLLNLRLPRVTGGAPPVASELLGSAGGAAIGGGRSPDANAILQWLKRLLAGQSGQGVATTRDDGGDGGGVGAGEMAAIQPGLSGAPGIAPLLSRDMMPNITLGNGPVGDSGPGFGAPRGGSGLMDAPAPEGGGDFPPLAPSYYPSYTDPFDVTNG
jgi:hypothetical protein